MVVVGAPAQPPKLQGHIMQIVFLEKELEDFLCKEKNLKKHLGLIFVARQVSIPPIGIVDILAFDWDSKSWVIIELKKDLLDMAALCQGLTYLNYYKRTSNYKDYYANNERKFKLLLIGQNLDDCLSKNTRYFDGCFDYDWDIYYKLFGLDIDSGIDFTFYSERQEKIDETLSEIWHEQSGKVKQTQLVRYFGHLNEI